MSDPIRIRGGAGPEEAAAIAAAVMLLLTEESARLSIPEPRPELSPWAAAGRFTTSGTPRGGPQRSGYSDPRPA